MTDRYQAVIGLEVHAQLLTARKAFSPESASYGDYPNTNTTAITLAHPGVLPVLNTNLVEMAIQMGLATNCKIRKISTFSRKNYFYPDLPKGYQISQYEDPICFDGYVEIEMQEGITKRIGITRIHMEEDSGKSIHDLDIDTLVDYNRAGTPLIEIVSEPDIRSAEEAYKYLQQIRQTVMYLGICTGNMEEGALRCDANVSVMPIDSDKFGTKAEVKNLNSFKNVEKAINYEIKRQINLIESGGKVKQETRLWDAGKNETRAMRSKEMAHDYRYFPEPDLVPVKIEETRINNIKSELPELPLQRKLRFIDTYKIPHYDATILVEEKELADFYEECCNSLENKEENNFKNVSNIIMTEILRVKSERNLSITELQIKPSLIAELVELFTKEIISSRILKEIFPEVLEGKSPKQIVEEKGLAQVSDTSMIDELVKKFINANPESVEKYRSGRKNIKGFFVGNVMKETKGKANPKLVDEIVTKYLEQ